MKNYRNFHEFDIDITEDSFTWVDPNEKTHEKWTPFMSFPITKSCNFNCIYCGDGGEATASKSNIIDLETIKKTTEVAIKNNIKKFRITGGEPFLHPKIGEILDFFSDLGYYTLVNTNGTMIMENKEIINRLNSNIKFAVSFDTFDENLSKFISGQIKSI